MALFLPLIFRIMNSPVAVKGVENEERIAPKRLKFWTESGLRLVKTASFVCILLAVIPPVTVKSPEMLAFWVIYSADALITSVCIFVIVADIVLRLVTKRFWIVELLKLEELDVIFSLTNKLPVIEVLPVTLNPLNSN